MILAAALTLTLSIHIEIDLTQLLRRAGRVAPPAVTCGIAVVGYRISGAPGRRFAYAGEVFEMPEEGVIELIAEPRRTSLRIDGRDVAMDGPRNQFGFMEVALPAAEPMKGERK